MPDMKIKLGISNGINVGVLGTRKGGGGVSIPDPTVSISVPAGTTLFSDDFSEANGTEINGKAGDTDYLGYKWVAVAGQFDVQSNKIHNVVTDKHAWIALPTPNFTITDTVTPEGTGGNEGIAFRYSDRDNFWYVRWRHASNAIQIIEVANGSTTVRATAAKTPNTPGETYTITIVCNGTTISATVAGTIATYNSATFNQYVSTAGVYGAGGSHANFTVTMTATENIPVAPNFSATNAASPLTTPTYDGSGNAMHPDVVIAPNGVSWNGYKYWMAMTPYPGDDNTKENPSILASNDGTTWVVPDGLTNPIVSAPGSPTFNSDPDLVFSADGLTLYMIYREATGSSSMRIYLRSSTDGVTWSGATQIYTSSVYLSMFSPSVIYDGSQYVMWAVDATTSGKTAPYRYRLMRSTSADMTTWSTPVATGLIINAKDLWHLNVIKGSQDYILLATVTAVNGGGTGNTLYLATSLDGLNWRAGTQVLGLSASGFDSNNVYRASCLEISKTSFDLFYSGRNGSAAWRTGRVTMTRA